MALDADRWVGAMYRDVAYAALFMVDRQKIMVSGGLTDSYHLRSY